MKTLLTLSGAFILAFSTHALAKPEASHNIEQFQTIFSDKILIVKKPLWEVSEANKRTASAIFLASDGTDFQCYFRDTKKDSHAKHYPYQGNPKSDMWRLTKPFFSSGVLFTTNNNNTRSIPIYDEKTNVLERWYKRKGGYRRLMVGHLQDSWPAWALEKCPDLKLPKSLKINHEQKTPDYQQNYETYDLTPSSKVVEPYPLEKLSQLLNGNTGNILVDSVGDKYIPNFPSHEFWKIDDAFNITDIARLANTQTELTIAWEQSQQTQTYKFGEHVYFKPNGKRHPAFEFSDWLQKQGPNQIYIEGKGHATFDFVSPTGVWVYPTDQVDPYHGNWKHLGGDIILSFSFIKNEADVYSFPWESAATDLEWPGLN